MKKAKEKNRKSEKGVTLIALITTIIILFILGSIGTLVGTSVIEFSQFSNFKNELEIIQNKVNELNQNTKVEIGQELTQEQKQILNLSEISDIILKNETEEEKTEIKENFRYFSSDYIKSEFNLEHIERDYLINVKYRYVIYEKGFKYNEKTYYMPEQIENGIYNVKYQNKNEETGSFEVNYTKEDNRWKIQISNINYNGYIDNWEIKYRLNEENYWKQATGLSFYVTKQGNYYVQVGKGENINLGIKLVEIIEDIEE